MPYCVIILRTENRPGIPSSRTSRETTTRHLTVEDIHQLGLVEKARSLYANIKADEIFDDDVYYRATPVVESQHNRMPNIFDQSDSHWSS